MNQDYKTCYDVVSVDNNLIKYVPINLIDFEMVKLTLKNKVNCFKRLPVEVVTEEVVMYLIENRLITLCRLDEYVAELEENNLPVANILYDLLDDDIFIHKCIKINGTNINYLSLSERTKEICVTAISNNIASIRYLPPEMHTFENHKDFISIFGIDAFRYIPYEYQTEELVTYVLKINIDMIHLVHNKKSISKEMADLLLSTSWKYLSYIPKEYITQPIAEAAFANNVNILYLLPSQYVTDEMKIKFIRNQSKKIMANKNKRDKNAYTSYHFSSSSNGVDCNS
jgi:hypothetical protein